MRLAVTVRAANGAVGETRHAVNDAVIAQRSIARLLDLEARLDGDADRDLQGRRRDRLDARPARPRTRWPRAARS